MLLRTTGTPRRLSRRIALLALLLPTACSETPAPRADPFYLAPSREPATPSFTPAGHDMDHTRGMQPAGGPSSMQDGPAAGADPSATGTPGNGGASFGTGSLGSAGGE